MLHTILRKKTIWLLFMAMVLLVVACTPGDSGLDEIPVDQPGSITDEITMYVEAKTYPCPEDETQNCLRVREVGGDWMVIDIPIEGFEHQEGIDYLLRVNKIRAINQPADVPLLRYELVEIVSQEETEPAEMENLDFLLNTNWDLVTMNGEAPVEDGTPTIKFEDNAINGTTGCNSYFGEYTLDGTNLSVGVLGQTEMFCEGRMDQEQAYLQMLMAAVSLTLEDETLTIHTGDGDGSTGGDRVTGGDLVFQPAEHQALEGTAWNLSGIATGDAIVNTWVDEQITAEFVDGRLSGNAGCNLYGTTYETSGSKITLGDIQSTMKACADDEIHARETEFLAALIKVDSFETVRNTLTFFDADGNVIMTFVAYV